VRRRKGAGRACLAVSTKGGNGLDMGGYASWEWQWDRYLDRTEGFSLFSFFSWSYECITNEELLAK
jgi:hypothetical protein